MCPQGDSSSGPGELSCLMRRSPCASLLLLTLFPHGGGQGHPTPSHHSDQPRCSLLTLRGPGGQGWVLQGWDIEPLQGHFPQRTQCDRHLPESRIQWPSRHLQPSLPGLARSGYPLPGTRHQSILHALALIFSHHFSPSSLYPLYTHISSSCSFSSPFTFLIHFLESKTKGFLHSGS